MPETHFPRITFPPTTLSRAGPSKSVISGFYCIVILKMGSYSYLENFRRTHILRNICYTTYINSNARV